MAPLVLGFERVPPILEIPTEEEYEFGVANEKYIKDQVVNYIRIAKEICDEEKIGWGDRVTDTVNIATMLQLQNIYDGER